MTEPLLQSSFICEGLLSPSFLQGNFAGYIIWDCQFWGVCFCFLTLTGCGAASFWLLWFQRRSCYRSRRCPPVSNASFLSSLFQKCLFVFSHWKFNDDASWQVKPTSQSTLLAMGIRYRACLPSSSRLQTLASPWGYSNAPITSSHGIQGSPHTLGTAKSASHAPCWLVNQLYSTVQASCGPDSSFPRLWVSVINKLLLISSDPCWVWGLPLSL